MMLHELRTPKASGLWRARLAGIENPSPPKMQKALNAGLRRGQ
jgi:hypothetical protein